MYKVKETAKARFSTSANKKHTQKSYTYEPSQFLKYINKKHFQVRNNYIIYLPYFYNVCEWYIIESYVDFGEQPVNNRQ